MTPRHGSMRPLVSSHDPPTLSAGEFAPMVMLLGTGFGDDEEEEEEEEEEQEEEG